MKRSFSLLLLPLALLACVDTSQRTSSAPARAVKQYTIEQFMDNEKIAGSSFSPDQTKILYSSNRSGIWNAYSLPVAGGEPTALTQSDSNSIYAIAYFPEDERLLFSSDQGGNEINHIYLLDTNGTARDLTPGEQAKASFYGWSHDRQSFFFGSNRRDPQFFDVYEVPVATLEPSLFYENKDGLDLADISPDKRYIVLTKSITTSNNEMYLVDRQTGQQTHLSPHEGNATYSPAYFSLDSQTLYYLTDEKGEFSTLRRYDLASGEHRDELAYDWDIMYAYLSHGGKYRVVGVNDDARNVIHVFDQENDGKEIDFPDVEGGDVTSVNIAPNEDLMTFYVGSSKSPSDLYVYNFATGEHRQLTHTLNAAIDPDDLVEGEVVRYASFDGTKIPALLYKPHQASADSLSPALVWVHGGPGGQSRLGYSPLLQYLTNQGYTVLAVNNRGSSGYGKTFFQMDDQKHGTEDLQDCIWGKKYLAETQYVDSSKIGIIGGSYGGYMVLAALAFQPQAFDVGVDIFGVANWLRTLKSIPPWWGSFRDALYAEMGNPETDSVALYNKSPLFHAQNIEKPLMVLQGANDPRVLKVESDEIVAAAKSNGVPVDYVVFDDEGHGFAKKENEIKGYTAIVAFLDQYLKNAPEAEVNLP
ncbi:Dipeptidyl aminopeptidase/acylaminoacyl peptidase [Catalinimonas alkaloidigena]|uniref:Dipeptidyl aminopeptidase/acylaminoacyl peptidase n=1 Tax=Catalinimonas alkaloidigena TaxID=1075417 RepID=A0A1G9EGS9_9BACT|nr:alpha/beta fold hydrolase [Catalinimonas alkaloidigena]SDK75326.1 Dipeptidyl aminopeptidase/acylaminoacyl peptidase [Catalinimonas alkaloidigena]